MDQILELLKVGLPAEAAIPFSGGLDSSVLLALSGGDAITVGFEGSEDMAYARRAFPLISKGTHVVHPLGEAEVKSAFDECRKLAPDFLKAEILVSVWITCALARENGMGSLAFGSGAEELFLGYERFFDMYGKLTEKEFMSMQKSELTAVKAGDCALVSMVCKQFGIRAHFPYLSEKLSEAVLSVPLERRIGSRRFKKLLLRHASAGLVPNFVLFRPKRAVQYGSGIHKFLMKLGNRKPIS